MAMAPHLETLTEALRFQPDLFQSGELWRMVTGHFVHESWPHLMVSAMLIVIVHLLFGRFLRGSDLVLLVLLVSIAISLGLSLAPQAAYYVGMSGLLYGLLVFGACRAIEKGMLTGYLVILVLSCKLAISQIFGPDRAMEQLIGLPVAVDAHQYGIISGLVCWIFHTLGRKLLSNHKLSVYDTPKSGCSTTTSGATISVLCLKSDQR
jgi:rhomboid family GlyGly-CTERM serine protease